MPKQKEGGKGSKKYGRHSRAPSNSRQEMRTAKNKRLRIERQARQEPKTMKIARGSARAKRRYGMTRKVYG